MGIKRKLLKKKKMIALFMAVILVVGGGGVIFFAKNTGKAAMNQEMKSDTVKTAQVETGEISNTIIGTGTLADMSTSEVLIPVGVKIDQVLVESGDTIGVGDTIATVDELSVREKILELKEEIESMEDEIDDLDTDDENYQLRYDLKESQLATMEESLETMETLLETCILTATVGGVVDSISISDQTVVEKSSSTGSSSSGSSSSESSFDGSSGTMGVSTSKTATATLLSLTYTQASAAETQSLESTDDTVVEVYGSLPLKIEKPETGKTPQAELKLDDTETRYKGSIHWNTSDTTFQGGIAYTATVYLTALEKGMLFPQISRPSMYQQKALVLSIMN